VIASLSCPIRAWATAAGTTALVQKGRGGMPERVKRESRFRTGALGVPRSSQTRLWE